MKAYQLKIQIKDSHPPIWRRVIVPAGLSFSQLSIVLNKVMGWCGYHLSSFEFKYLGIQLEEDPDVFSDYCFGDCEINDSAATIIDSYLDSENWFTYTYDFGDDWQHRVTVEKRMTDYDKNYAQVLKYKGETPYEDCGGIYGYYQLLEVLENPHDPEYEEMKEWTEDHFTVEYDLEEVNSELAAMYLSDEKSAPVTQNEIMEKGGPFKQIQGDREIKLGGDDDGWDNEEWDDEGGDEDWLDGMQDGDQDLDMLPDSPEELEEMLGLLKDFKKKMMNGELQSDSEKVWRSWAEERAEDVTLRGILEYYSKEELTEIAKIHHLRGYSKYKKDGLLDFLSRELLDPDVMRRYFTYLDDETLGLLKGKTNYRELSFTDDDYNYLTAGGYAGYSSYAFSELVVVPKEVQEAYVKYCDKEWEKQRKEEMMLLYHLNAAVQLNGICSLTDAARIYEHNMKEKKDELSLTAFCMDVPEAFKCFVLKDNCLVFRGLTDPKSIKELLKLQQGEKLYLPDLSEVECLGAHDYLPFDKYMNLLERFFINECDEEKEDAQEMCRDIQGIIRIGGVVDAVVDYLYEECMDFEFIMEDQQAADKLFARLKDVWDHTRMVIHRGHTPEETRGNLKVLNNPQDNIIQFPGAAKKIYPNDPCPCGSGKKYKYCCGKKK